MKPCDRRRPLQLLPNHLHLTEAQRRPHRPLSVAKKMRRGKDVLTSAGGRSFAGGGEK